MIKTDICVIGAGSGGLSVAAGASQMGANVVLIEQGAMGGDCLNFGCVPSKSILTVAKRMQLIREAKQFGIHSQAPQVDYQGVHDYIQQVIATIAPNDSKQRFESLGVNVIEGSARFIDPHTVSVNDKKITAKRIVIATGSSAVAPPIPGIEQVPYLTNETIFNLKEQPKKLIVIGGGPIGCELSQAHALLGTPVVTLEAFNILPKDDPDCVEIIRQQLIKNGIALHESVKVLRVSQSDNGFLVMIEKSGEQQTIEGSHLLVAAGRKPNVDGLDLEKAGVDYSKKGITVDARLRTTQKHIYAIGDAAGSFQFTHAANYHAGIVIRNVLFRLPAKVNYKALPWVTYTHPELAHVGLNETMLKEKEIKHEVVRFPFNEIDRAIAEHETDGFIKVMLSPKGKILGASVVGAQAGELILPWVQALNNHLKMSAFANLIAPYPTRSEISKRVAGAFYAPKLFSSRVKRIVGFLLKI